MFGHNYRLVPILLDLCRQPQIFAGSFSMDACRQRSLHFLSSVYVYSRAGRSYMVSVNFRVEKLTLNERRFMMLPH